ncbi:hypothetical protein CWI84_09145 [Idiomarina tyrosinivorans]|uniref:Uncharacterized protein n=1 Tax=Idiomarina tyrosinivorans TaxID=1445662 RepID=A0A432ZPG2_9GAMM|nr:DUF6170 family protein [Idiomarina tyrosinivorans]RUO79784.1 hypothetical protein CWI84_09145 [Idiomarina tyrosinivorans]
MYFSPRSIPQLAPYSLIERATIVRLANEMMPVPRRFVANMSKLVLLSALFVLLVSIDNWGARIVALLAVGLCYPLILQPIALNLSLPYLDAAVKRFEAERSSAVDDELS